MFQYFMGLLLLASTFVYASKIEKPMLFEEQRGETTFAKAAAHVNHLEENLSLTQNDRSQEEPIKQHSGEERYASSIWREDEERKPSQKKYVEKGYRFNIFDVVNPN